MLKNFAHLLLALALAAGPGVSVARAQAAEPQVVTEVAAADRLSRVEAENAALKRELRALKERVEAQEAALRDVRERLAGPAAVSIAAGPPAVGAVYLDMTGDPRIPEDRSTIIVPGLDVSRLGAATPEALAEALTTALQSKEVEHRGASAAFDSAFSSLSAFAPDRLRFPEALWAQVKPAGFPGTPTRRGLEDALGFLPSTVRAAYASHVKLGDTGASFTVESTYSLSPIMTQRVVWSGVRVNGRCFVAHAASDCARELTRSYMLWIAGRLVAMAGEGGVPASFAAFEEAYRRELQAREVAPFGEAIDDYVRRKFWY